MPEHKPTADVRQKAPERTGTTPETGLVDEVGPTPIEALGSTLGAAPPPPPPPPGSNDTIPTARRRALMRKLGPVLGNQHVQRSIAPRIIMRDNDNASHPGPNSTQGPEPPNSTPAPAAGSYVTFKGTFLTEGEEQVRKALEEIGKTSSLDGIKKFASDFESGVINKENIEIPQDTPDDLPKRILSVVQQQVAVLETKKERLLLSFESSAKAYTAGLLDESEKVVKAEEERYGLKPTDKPSTDDPTNPNPAERQGGVQTERPGQVADNQDTKEMMAAAQELSKMKKELRDLRVEENTLSANQDDPSNPNPAQRQSGEPPAESEETAKRRKELRAKIEPLEKQYNLTRATHEAKFPILAAYNDDDPSSLAAIAANPTSAASTLGPLIAEKLENIETVRKGLNSGKFSVWKQETIRKGTMAQLGIEEKSFDSKLIEENAAKIESDEMISNIAIAVISIALGLIAALPTAGASMGVAAAATAAATGAGAISVVQAAKAIEQYQIEKAATGTTFDKAKAISKEDPSLFWLALDIVGAIADVRGALSAFKALGPMVRSALAARAAVKAGEDAMKAAGMAEHLKALKSACAEHAGLYEKIATQIGEAADAAKPALDALEQTARAQYKALADAGRLKEIGDISEEVFVKQVVSGARSQVVVSGEKGLARTNLINSLMQPGNPLMDAILKAGGAGLDEAADTLLIQYGNWKQLMTMLDSGTPEMRQAAQKLLARRQVIEAEVEKEFQAMLAGKPSKMAVSDVDRSTQGMHAGADMIAAEKYVKEKYGAGWSETLRMNFYTDANRLTKYEEIMSKLSPEEAAKLLSKNTKEAEIYNVAKMLKHAHGDPKRLAEVESYAKTIGVSVNDPKIQELLPKLGGDAAIEERNKLLLEIDDLMNRFQKAQPGSPDQIALAQEISSKQMRANAFTDEAYIGPGAGRMTVGGVKVVGQEAYQAALSNIEMVQHIIGQANGDIVLASRQYELYKYINRFASSAEMAGVKRADLEQWKSFSGFVYKTERGAVDDVSHLRKRNPASGLGDGEIEDADLQAAYNNWKGFSQAVLSEMKKIAEENPGAWAPK